MSFWTALADELGERRRRMRKALQPWRAGLVEFCLFAGFILGLAAPLIHGAQALDWRLGLLPRVLFALAYVLLDVRRQAALKTGEEEEAVRRAHRAPAIATAAITSAMGLALYAAPLMLRAPADAAPVAAEPASDFLPSEPVDAPVTEIIR